MLVCSHSCTVIWNCLNCSIFRYIVQNCRNLRPLFWIVEFRLCIGLGRPWHFTPVNLHVGMGWLCEKAISERVLRADACQIFAKPSRPTYPFLTENICYPKQFLDIMVRLVVSVVWRKVSTKLCKSIFWKQSSNYYKTSQCRVDSVFK